MNARKDNTLPERLKKYVEIKTQFVLQWTASSERREAENSHLIGRCVEHKIFSVFNFT